MEYIKQLEQERLEAQQQIMSGHLDAQSKAIALQKVRRITKVLNRG